ncbi:molecular chaperone HtpG, partial [archaeon]
MSAKAETLEFQAETRKLLDIVTNSIYTDKEVFIRELISNASDAIEKYRYNQVKGTVVVSEGNSSPEIHILADNNANTLTIVDTGIGMTRDELVSNLGTIARSGSKNFVEQIKKEGGKEGGESAPAPHTDGIIGQFGVGFYASFMVADHVSV